MPKIDATTIEKRGWFHGNFQMVCDGDGSQPDGKVMYRRIFGYDADAKQYTAYDHFSRGDTRLWIGTFSDRELKMEWRGRRNAQDIQMRRILTLESPSSYSTKTEINMGKGWTPFAQGSFKKQ